MEAQIQRGLTRRKLIIGATTTVAAITATALGVSKITKEQQPPSLKDRILSFTWKDAQNPEKLETFIESLAMGYMELSGSTRVTKEQLLENTHFYNNRVAYLTAVQKVSPRYNSNQTAYTHFASGQSFIDLATQKKYVESKGEKSGGLFIANLVYHEWGHLDITESINGKSINNPNYSFRTPEGKDEVYRKSRGAYITTDTYFGFVDFEEVLNETIINRRFIEQLGFSPDGPYKEVITTSDYYRNGTAVFLPFSMRHITLSELYRLHATSDFDGIIDTMGKYLPGNNTPTYKGRELAIGIHDKDLRRIQETGVFQTLNNVSP